MSNIGIYKMKEPLALTQLKDRLSNYVFATKGPDAHALQELMFQKTRAKHMAFWLNGKCLDAFLYYGEKSRTIARKKDLSLESIQTIGRIADDACMFFWKHRQRAGGNLAKDLNFSIESATNDLHNELGLREIFEQMEKEIIRIAWFSDLKEEPVNKILLLEDRIAALEKSNAALGIEVQEIKRGACPIVSYPGPVVPPPLPPSDDTSAGFGYNVTIFDKPTTL